jgi:deoxyribonuclease-4
MCAAGGLYIAFARGDAAGCDWMLVFTKSNRQWNAKPITQEDVELYREAAAKYDHMHPVAVHASYLINIASPDEELWGKSYLALRDEVERAAAFDIPMLTFHPGSFMGGAAESGMDLIVRGLKRLLEETAESAPNVTVCVENMAGQGTHIGRSFEQLAYILSSVDGGERLGVCFDTCHAFAAGSDIRTPETYAQTMSTFDEIVGCDRIICFHLNDSKHPLGSNKDRHEHIGQGSIGKAGFANFVNDPRWADHPAHLETPKTEKDEEGNTVEMDLVNLKMLRDLIK